jgi:hypothetical protein
LDQWIVLCNQAAQPDVRGRLAVGQVVHHLPRGPAAIGNGMIKLDLADPGDGRFDIGVSSSKPIQERGTIHGAKDTGTTWQTASVTSGAPGPVPDTGALPFERLDFVYMPSGDVAADVRWFTQTLGGRLVFAVEAMETRVAMIALTESPPRILLAGHLEGDRPILVYRVARITDALAALEARGWKRERSIEIPQGPLCSFSAPGGQRIAVYELVRPDVEEHFAGRRDF